MNLKIEVTLDELNYILVALSERPYKEVVQLIQKIRTQGQEQVREIEQAKSETDEPIHSDK